MPRDAHAFLRTVLLADAGLSGVAGLVTALAAGPLAALLGIPAPLLVAAGLILVAYAAGVALLARRPSIPRAALRAVIGINLLWGVECIALPMLGWIEPTGLGWAFLLAQTAFVLVVADLLWLGGRRTAALPA